MIVFLIRRILSNKWLFVCLLIGSVAAASIFCSIPMYSNAILQKVLTKDLQNYHVELGHSPGKYTVSHESMYYGGKITEEFEGIIQNRLSQDYMMPVECSVKEAESSALKIRREGYEQAKREKYASMISLSDLEENIEIVHGRMMNGSKNNNVYEVMVTEKAMKQLDLLLGATYSLLYDNLSKADEEILKVKVVGIFSAKIDNQLYWSNRRMADLEEAFVIDDTNLQGIINEKERVRLSQVKWEYYFDYNKIHIKDVGNILGIFKNQKRWAAQDNIVKIETPLENVLESYEAKERQLKITLWILTVPLMIIICMYTFLITGLIIENDKNEIAVLKSRGAGSFQIFSIYVVESVLIGGFAFIVGPLAAYYICSLLGAANGFMEFINRKALNVEISPDIYIYSLIASGVFVLLILSPALNASRVSIVQYKKSKLNTSEKPIWEKYFLDLLVLGVSVYGLYRFNNRQDILGITGLEGTELSIDPLLYFISSFFILGVSLVFLRIYPILISLVFKMGERWWGAAAYFSLLNAGRSQKKSRFIMLFIILSLAFGIMNANQARTINRNIEEKVMYKTGADVVIEPYNNLKHSTTGMSFPSVGLQMGEEIEAMENDKVEYDEPPYEDYEDISGVEFMTKVIVDNQARLSSSSESIRDVRMLAINPYEFGKTAWYREGLLANHINEYLNLMIGAPRAVLLSSNIKEKYDIRKGDELSISWGEDSSLKFTVYAFVDFFPSCNPYAIEQGNTDKYFVVLNYSYIERKLPPQPYEIWIKKQVGVTDTSINNQLIERELKVERVDYADQGIVKSKNEPMLQGTNGVLTMCFIVTMLIVIIGFLIFWILSMNNRALSFGIFRAIGMSFSGVTRIIIFEQILISACALITGVLLGSIGSRVFIPMLQMIYSSSEQVPPFLIVASRNDYLKVISTATIMMLFALGVLFILIRKIKINQVIKLGED